MTKTIVTYTHNPAAYKSFAKFNTLKALNTAFEMWLADHKRLFGKKELQALKTLIRHSYPYFGNHTYEIGWVFNPTYFNKGYATEAAFATLKYGFEKMGLHRIIATCQPENIASYRIMEKIGMRKEGFFKKCIPYGDEWWDEYYYAILNEEWGR